MVSVLTLPIKASHLLASLTGARHHVLEGAEPAAPRRKGLKENHSLEEGGRERGWQRGGGTGGTTLIAVMVDWLILQGKLKNINNSLESDHCQLQ